MTALICIEPIATMTIIRTMLRWMPRVVMWIVVVRMVVWIVAWIVPMIWVVYPRRFDTSRHGQPGQPRAGHSTGEQPGSRPGNAPVLGASHGFLPALCGGNPVLRLCFVVVFVRLPCGFRTGFLLGSSWASSPVPPPGLSFSSVSNHSDFGLFVAALGAVGLGSGSHFLRDHR